MSHTSGLEEVSAKTAFHCGRCGKAIYFVGAAYWRHSHSESMFCEGVHQVTYPAQYDEPGVGKQLLEALKEAIPEGGDWWCPTCQESLGGSRVTSSECCDTCGTYLGGIAAPEWIAKARAAIAKATGGAA